MEYNNLENGRTQITQHNMSLKEILHSYANRLLYSRFYVGLYVTLILFTIITLILSIFEDSCPSGWFIFLEIVINSAMVLEVGLRIFALGSSYWESKLNILDILLVLLCIVTMILLATGCSRSVDREAVIDTVFLSLRNVLQFIRLCIAIQKNKRNLSARENTIDFTSLSSRATSANGTGHYDNEYSLQQIATSDGFVLDDDDDDL